MKLEATATVALLLFLLLAPPSPRVSMAGSGNRQQLHDLMPFLMLGWAYLGYSHDRASSSSFGFWAAFCDGKCGVRCSKASRHDDCLKYCGICCATCNCVPSGTAGHKDECPCYRDMTTGHGNRTRPKCP
jgi:hypothetical protein